MSNNKICESADKILENFINSLEDVQTSHHRVDSQKIKCNFGQMGVCCKLCANGPCRITPTSPKGICGANADTIVGRNFLRAVAAGSGCYIHIVENTARNIKSLGESGGEIKGIHTLNNLAEKLGITETAPHKKAVLVADAILKDLYKPKFEKMEVINKIAYEPRLKNWEELNIMPGGAKSEVFDGIVETSTNLNSDPVNMLLTCLRLGISTGIYGLTLTNLLNDIILGEPKIRAAKVGFKVVDPDYINLMITGHQHSMIAHLQDKLIEPEITQKANKVGAKGFRLVGCTCVGQDLQLRGEHYTEVFSGHAGNNFTSEALIATGGIDAVELAKELIKRNIIILSAGCSSGGLENVGLMSPGAAELAGDSLKEVCKSLGIPPVLNFGPCLAIGRLEIVAKELAEYLNIDIPKLPLVLSAPQWLEEQALADGSFGLALGLPLHLAISPFIGGSEVVTKVLCEDMVNLTGGKLIIEDDIVKAADILEETIIERRKSLGLD